MPCIPNQYFLYIPNLYLLYILNQFLLHIYTKSLFAIYTKSIFAIYTNQYLQIANQYLQIANQYLPIPKMLRNILMPVVTLIYKHDEVLNEEYILYSMKITSDKYLWEKTLWYFSLQKRLISLIKFSKENIQKRKKQGQFEESRTSPLSVDWLLHQASNRSETLLYQGGCT